MTHKLVGVFGASGFGQEVMPLVRHQLREDGIDLVFVDDNPSAGELNGYPILTYTEFLDCPQPEKAISIAIADSGIRDKLTARCLGDNIQLLNVLAENSVCLDEVSIGPGSILCPFVTLTSNIKIGQSFHANIYSYVAHDCVIGDFVTFAPAVKCNGNIIIEDYAYIGTGAILRQGTPDEPLVIGRGAVVGMGAVVTKDVPAGTVVIGNPAKPLVRA